MGCTVGRESSEWQGLLWHALFSCRACVTDSWRLDLNQHGHSLGRKKLLHKCFTVGNGRGEFIACTQGIIRKKKKKLRKKNYTNHLWVFLCVAQVDREQKTFQKAKQKSLVTVTMGRQ